MRSLTNKYQKISIALALAAGFAGSAQAGIDLTGASYVTYGDANSYALQVDGVIAGSTGPGSLYYVNSTPGAIQDLIVVATGASGGPVNTNFAGMEDALSTPNGKNGSNFFSDVWTSTLTAFTSFLAGENPLFFFNNNQIGGETSENLAVWAQISLTGKDSSGLALPTIFFDFTNRNSRYALFTEGGGGDYMGLNFPASGYTSSGAGPIAGTNDATDYVLSGGQICLTSANIPVSCSQPHAVGPINNNLGANQAAYAIDVPDLNTFLSLWTLDSGYTHINVDLRFGCDPATGSTVGVGDCVRRDANNGYEQLFIGTSTRVTNVPEPGTVALLGIGILGLFAGYRRKI